MANSDTLRLADYSVDKFDSCQSKGMFIGVLSSLAVLSRFALKSPRSRFVKIPLLLIGANIGGNFGSEMGERYYYMMYGSAATSVDTTNEKK